MEDIIIVWDFKKFKIGTGWLSVDIHVLPVILIYLEEMVYQMESL